MRKYVLGTIIGKTIRILWGSWLAVSCSVESLVRGAKVGRLLRAKLGTRNFGKEPVATMVSLQGKIREISSQTSGHF